MLEAEVKKMQDFYGEQSYQQYRSSNNQSKNMELIEAENKFLRQRIEQMRLRQNELEGYIREMHNEKQESQKEMGEMKIRAL